MKKRCTKCKKIRVVSCFYKEALNKDGLQYHCKDCTLHRVKRYYKRIIKDPKIKKKLLMRQKNWLLAHPLRAKEIQSKRIKKYRLILLQAYSSDTPKCACCGEAEIQFLTIDHIDGGGNKQKKELGVNHLGEWLRKMNYPKGFQVLCYNCNCSKGHYGKCPHKLTK